ncbi:peptidylprolyl isomerase [Sphingosinicellaceae bacterium]|nr:peptidylprolyl isomerase [Sphingosinicellaceae bacterium]
MILLSLALAAAAPTTAEILKDAPAAAWLAVPPEDLLVVDSAKGRVVIQLAPWFAPVHVAAIRALARAGSFEGGGVVRVQDNYVVQFAAKESRDTTPGATPGPTDSAPGPKLAAEYDWPAGKTFTALPYRDAYAAQAGFDRGWPVARAGGREWLVHCYAMVGAGRNLAPDTGDGSELYAVIGHAPRHLDRNMAVVGRVVQGMANWSALPRGTEEMGFYKTEAERTVVTRVRVASDLPVAERPRFEVMDTASPSFKSLIEARANRSEPFFGKPAGGVDVCNVAVPVRSVP